MTRTLGKAAVRSGLQKRDRTPAAIASIAPFVQADSSAYGNLRSEEHTSEPQSLMRTSYAVLCLKKKTTSATTPSPTTYIQHYIDFIINRRTSSIYNVSN